MGFLRNTTSGGTVMADHAWRDVEDRIRTDVALLLRKYARRLKEQALAIAKADYDTNGLGNRTIEEIADAAFADAGERTGLISAARTLAGPRTDQN